jgi:hypothetical protein
LELVMGKFDDLITTVGRAAPPPKYIRAYHGSPHSFDRFDASKIGTGEGNQAYGYGLYFADSENVADVYRKGLSGPYSQALAPDEDIPQFFAPGNLVPSYGGQDKVLRFFPGPESEPWRWSVEVVSADAAGNPKPYERPRIHSTRPSLRAADRVLGREPRRPGHSYEVELQVPEEALLDWDAPLNRQPDYVRSALEEIGINTRPFSGKFMGFPVEGVVPTGRHAYEDAASLAKRSGVPLGERQATAAKTLLEAGVPGIRYFDGKSRSAGQGTRNYVMFPGTEDSIRILRKYGLLAPMAAGAMGEQE